MKRSQMIEEIALRLNLMKSLDKTAEQMAEIALTICEAHGMLPPLNMHKYYTVTKLNMAEDLDYENITKYYENIRKWESENG